MFLCQLFFIFGYTISGTKSTELLIKPPIFQYHFSTDLLTTHQLLTMSTTFELRTSKKVGYATVQVRVQSTVLDVNIRQSTKLKVPISKWKLSRDSTAFKNYAKSKEGSQVLEKLSTIANRIDSKLALGRPIMATEVRQIINSTIYEREIIALENSNKENTIEYPDNISLNEYYKIYIDEMKNGERHTNRGTRYAKGTIDAFNQTYHQFTYFQQEMNLFVDFDDINMTFYKKYTRYLESKQYTLNSIGKCISVLKSILNSAECDGINKNTKYKDKRFKASNTEVDAIYLTHEDLQKIVSLDLSNTGNKIYEHVRDIFIVGVCTAQRVSDYSRITPECIKHQESHIIQDGEIVKKKYDVIELIQQKTKTKVSIPISSQLFAILKKYDYKLPKVRDLTINKYIKEIGKMAGINQIVETKKITSGTYITQHKPKYELIYTHTARRTGATLMYLAGMDVYDIMKITGHSSPTMLKRYIKADSLDIANKIVSKYDYFN